MPRTSPDQYHSCPGEFSPEYAGLAEALRDVVPSGRAVSDVTPEDMERYRALMDGPGVADLPPVVASDATAPGPNGPIGVRVYRPLAPSDSPRAGLVWLHGGGFRFGDLDMPEADHTSRILAHEADAVVVSVDYRLANDGVHHPVLHDDCLAAFQWVAAHADELGVDPGRIAVGGASAGGALAGTVALHLRDLGTPPWQAILTYPATHPVLPEASEELLRKIAVLPRALLAGGHPGEPDGAAENYLGHRDYDRTDAYAFPGVAADLTGYPPTLVDNNEFDSLRSGGEAFAHALAAAGVDVELHTNPGALHGHLNRPGSADARRTLARYAERLRGDF